MNRILRLESAVLLAVVAVVGGCTGAQAPEAASSGPVAVELSTQQAAFAAQADVRVTVTFRNTSAAPVQLLKWLTPYEDVEEAIFRVERDGEPVAFVGPHYKRPAPGPEDFVTLQPGEAFTRTVSLGDTYDLSQSGAYSVRYEADPLEATRLVVGRAALRSNALELWADGRPNLHVANEVDAMVTSSVSFSGRCDSTQQSTLLTALSNAASYSDGALNYLSTTTPGGTPRYTTWFGAYSSSGWSTAKSHFTAIADAFNTKAVTLDCSCKKSYYAYVYPTQPYKIYVCRAFWSAPMTGTDSKAGTLVHEMSHFNVTAATDDHVYGQTNCKSLAKSDPAAALDNADSHEYFAENTPFQN